VSNPRAIAHGLFIAIIGYGLWTQGVWFGLFLFIAGGALALAGANPKPPTGV